MQRRLDAVEDRVPPIAALAVAVLAVSTSAILIRWSNAPSVVKAFYRVAFTVALLAPLAITRYRSGIAALSRRDLAVAGGAGVALACHFAVWFESLEWTTVAASVTLVQAQPLFVAIGAYLLLDEQLTGRLIGGIALALAGMVVLTSPGLGALAGVRPVYGNTLALAGGVMLAAYFLVGRSLRQRIALVPYVIVVYTVCAVVLLGIAVADGAAVGPSAYPPREWALFLAMAVGPGILGHTVTNWALEHLESSVVSVSYLGEPVGSAVLALLLLGERPGLRTVIGGLVVLAGIYVTVRARRV